MPSAAQVFPTVVLVDDDASLREALRFVLEIEGFAVEERDSGEALLALPLPDARACLVVDHNLGGISGMEALERLRERGVDLPAIMITSVASSLLRSRARRCNAWVVEKPLLTDALFGAIRAAT